MTPSLDILRGRLCAEVVAADLRDPSKFTRAGLELSWMDVARYVRRRAEEHRRDLILRPADMEAALEVVESEWRPILEHDAPPVRSVKFLVRAARALLQRDGCDMILRVDRCDPGREILRWRFVSLRVPPGVLLAAATDRCEPVAERVRILDRSFAPDCPVAQHHVHQVAMMSFEDLWARLRVRAVLEADALKRSLQDERAVCPELHGGACVDWTEGGQDVHRGPHPRHIAHMAEWSEVLRHAFLAGEILKRHDGHGGSLAECPQEGCGQKVLRALKGFKDGRWTQVAEHRMEYIWRDVRVRLAQQRRNLTESAMEFGAASGRVQEAEFLARAFARLQVDATESPDPNYERLLMQYLRVKSAVFGLLTHSPGAKGLDRFLDHFRQIKVYAPGSDELTAMSATEPGLDVCATEYRVAPDAWLQGLREVDGGPTGSAEGGWVVHFKRERSGRTTPMFAGVFQRMNGDSHRMGRALRAEPRRLRTLRGLDVCGVEDTQPLWVAVEALRGLRREAERIVRARPELGLDPLRLTLHVGEDFRALTSGVRAIAEPFHWKLLERGDRIGHGIAVTLDPTKWWRRHEGEVMRVTRFDRLLDLAFLAEYSEYSKSARCSRSAEWLRHEIGNTIEVLGIDRSSAGNDRSERDVVETARKMWSTLGSDTVRRLMSSEDGGDGSRHENWIRCYLWNESVQERAGEEMRIPVWGRRWHPGRTA